MKYILHRLGIKFSPSLTFKGVGPFPIQFARKRFEQLERRLEELLRKKMEDVE